MPRARRTRLAATLLAKYGLFIHWGLYAVPAGVWNGKTIPEIGDRFGVYYSQAQDSLAAFVAPGHWNDPDMLETGTAA